MGGLIYYPWEIICVHICKIFENKKTTVLCLIQYCGKQQYQPVEWSKHLLHVHAHSCLTVCNHKDRSLPGSSVHGIYQARILESVAISFFRGSSQLRDPTHVSCISCLAGRVFTTEPPGKYLLNMHDCEGHHASQHRSLEETQFTLEDLRTSWTMKTCWYDPFLLLTSKDYINY